MLNLVVVLICLAMRRVHLMNLLVLVMMIVDLVDLTDLSEKKKEITDWITISSYCKYKQINL